MAIVVEPIHLLTVAAFSQNYKFIFLRVTLWQRSLPKHKNLTVFLRNFNDKEFLFILKKDLLN